MPAAPTPGFASSTRSRSRSHRTPQAAQHATRALGFVEEPDYTRYVHSYSGTPHDLVVMELKVCPAPPVDQVEPAQYMC
jgi:hypothetical protein